MLEGRVIVRTPQGEEEASRGDAVSFPTGPDGAHQLINRSEEPARVLMLSTMIEPEIAEYPDSGKVGVFAGKAPGATGPGMQKFLDGAAIVPYFDD